jgi:hypothetical protein
LIVPRNPVGKIGFLGGTGIYAFLHECKKAEVSIPPQPTAFDCYLAERMTAFVDVQDLSMTPDVDSPFWGQLFGRHGSGLS